MSPEVSAWLHLVEILISCGISVTLWRVSQAVKRYERLEDKSGEAVGKLEERLHATTQALIDTRFREMSHSVGQTANAVKLSLEEVRKRLESGDVEIDGLDDADHRLELKVAGQLGEIKDWLRDKAASREDLKDHERHVSQQFEKVGERIGGMERTVAVLSDRVGKRE